MESTGYSYKMESCASGNIQNSEFIRYTMLNGRLYDAETMNETGNYNRKRLPFFFEQQGSGNAWPMYGEGQGFMHSGCQCGN